MRRRTSPFWPWEAWSAPGEHIREKSKGGGLPARWPTGGFVKPIDTELVDRPCKKPQTTIVTWRKMCFRAVMAAGDRVYPQTLSSCEGDEISPYRTDMSSTAMCRCSRKGLGIDSDSIPADENMGLWARY